MYRERIERVSQIGIEKEQKELDRQVYIKSRMSQIDRQSDRVERVRQIGNRERIEGVGYIYRQGDKDRQIERVRQMARGSDK